MPNTPSSFPGVLLLCVDLQPVFIKAVAHGDALRQRCAFAIEAATTLGLPVAFTEQMPVKLGGTDPKLVKLAPTAGIYAKNTFSVFADDGIRDALRTMDIEHVILCGLETSVCIYQTALGALEANTQVTVLTDAVSARRPDDAAACLSALARSGVHLLPSETIFYALLHDAAHPLFKDFTKLVKKYS
ncbi:MAG TPA: isochorismatase family protein [Rariglobus sp.]|jgi:nicotinamidase-related amidase|nr:isochorismatase family protein [Rariglobus sp.]